VPVPKSVPVPGFNDGLESVRSAEEREDSGSAESSSSESPQERGVSGTGSGSTPALFMGRMNCRFERLTISCPRRCRGYLTVTANRVGM
jgi:hypothetical protein